jgi:ParB family transcriptional regulator, chromosome partitioning protein
VGILGQLFLSFKILSGFSMFSTTITDSPSYLPLQQIKLPIQQPRRYFDPQAMQSLVQSVQQHGILEPLLVRIGCNESYELVAGERRLRAAHAVGLVEVPVVIKELSDHEALKISILENLLREDLNPLEETEGILQLLEVNLAMSLEQVISTLYRMQNDAHRSTHNVMGQPEARLVLSVFHEVGMSWESFVNNRLPLLKLPEDVLNALRQGQLAYTKAIAIARVKDSKQRQLLLDNAVAENLSLAAIREQISALLKAPTAADTLMAQLPTPSLKSIFDSTYRFVRKANVWDDPEKRVRVEQLLSELRQIAET